MFYASNEFYEIVEPKEGDVDKEGRFGKTGQWTRRHSSEALSSSGCELTGYVPDTILFGFMNDVS